MGHQAHNAKYQEKRKFVKAEKKLEKKHYALIILLMSICVIYHSFIQPVTLGHDKRYAFFIFILPTLLGVLALGVYRRKFLINRFILNKGFFLWAFMFFFYLTEGIFCSYLSLGQAANITWNIINEKTAKQNQTETYHCPVDRFWLGRKTNNIDFIFQGRFEQIDVPYSSIKDYVHKDPKKYQLSIDVQKGIWNYYILNSWSLQEK